MNKMWQQGPLWQDTGNFVGYTSLANQWMSETQKRNRPTGEKVCTDLFLLNSSRFNQQIIDLIKWHPLLGQEPARSMQISQAKKKKTTSMHTHSTSPTEPNTSMSVSALRGTLKSMPHSHPSHQKQIQAETEEEDQGALQHKIQSGDRADRTRQKLPMQNKPSLRNTESLGQD